MGNIHVLDITVANLIAAGEVVERPANAVKELVENAIDAGSTQITVEIRRGGVAFMRVTDNGCGMSAEDAVTALRRHATSKIKSASDLAAIGTLGFRGEALAAITAVSAFRLMTKRPADTEGTLISGGYGKTEEITGTGCPDGTTVICERLFATTPARLKFLKSDSSEGSAVASAMEKLAVSHPEIAFRFISDGNLKFSTAGDGVLKNAIYSVYGSAFAGKLIAVQGGNRGIRVEGYISTPDAPRGNRAMQQFFINERSVRSKNLTAALEAAFSSYLAPQKFPSCVLNIQIAPSLVDVNIHPAKLEVKFSDEKAVFDALYSAVRGTLVSSVNRPVLAFTTEAMRLEGNLQAEKAPMTGEQMKLDVRFEEAKEKGKASETPPSNTPEMTRNEGETTPKHAFSVENDKKNTAHPPLIPPFQGHLSPSGDHFPANGEVKTSEIASKLYAAPQNASMKSVEVLDDDDITVDVPPMPRDPMKKGALASAHDPKAFSFRSRLYSGEIRDAASVLREEREAKPIVSTEKAEEIPYIPRDTDANIKGEMAKPIPAYRIVGEVFNSYVILEVEDKMLLIDKHAAHERINYERMRANMDLSAPNIQMLLVPDTLTLTGEEAALAEDFRGELEGVGFQFEMSGGEVKLLGIPEGMPRNEAVSLFGTLISEMSENGAPIADQRRDRFEKALYQTACKASVKAGRRYDEAHIRWICDNLLRYDCIKFCPHGRPVAFELSKKDLDNRFGRT